jgi:hypothetical protein
MLMKQKHKHYIAMNEIHTRLGFSILIGKRRQRLRSSSTLHKDNYI